MNATANSEYYQLSAWEPPAWTSKEVDVLQAAILQFSSSLIYPFDSIGVLKKDYD